MAYDKVVDSAALDGALTGIADAIREKTGSAEKLTLDGMAAAIAGISGGGGSASVSEVTLATSFSDADAGRSVLEAMANSTYTLFVYTGQSKAENQLYSAVIDKTAIISDGHMISYTRYKSGSLAIVGGIGSAYSLIGSVGDTFLMIGGDAP